MPAPLIVFKAINKESDQQLLFQKVLADQETLCLKDKDNHEIILTPISVNSNLQFKCHIKDSEIPTGSGSKYLMHFTAGNERYLCDVNLRLQNDLAIVTILNLFHMQKRRHYRYVLPKNISASLHVQAINGVKSPFSGRLLDLSTEGCALEISQEDTSVSLNEVISAQVVLGSKPPITVEGLVKNIRASGPTLLILGIEFNHLAQTSEASIITALTEIQRDVYFKKSA